MTKNCDKFILVTKKENSDLNIGVIDPIFHKLEKVPSSKDLQSNSSTKPNLTLKQKGLSHFSVSVTSIGNSFKVMCHFSTLSHT